MLLLQLGSGKSSSNALTTGIVRGVGILGTFMEVGDIIAVLNAAGGF